MDVAGQTAAAAGVSNDIPAFLLVGVFWVAFFSWVTVVGWAIQRRKEREAYYRHETEKRLVDKSGVSAEQLLGLRNEEERIRWLRRREGLKLGGLVTLAAGIGIVVALRFVDTGELSISVTGWIPLGIGVVLLLYTYVLYPTSPSLGGGIPSIPSDERRADEQL
jgi:hypothetical protein